MIIVTRGKKGSDFVFSNNKVNKELSSPSIEVDSTGAGDIFHGAFVYGLANNFEYEKYENMDYQFSEKNIIYCIDNEQLLIKFSLEI